MSEDTEQNVRTRDEQIRVLANLRDEVLPTRTGNAAREYAEAFVFEAEARGAEEQRRKDGEGLEPVAWLVEQKGVQAPFFTQNKLAIESQFITKITPLYTHPANVAALEEKTERRRWHVKRGTEYRLIGRGKIQQNGPSDMAEVMIYQDVNDGSFWVRPPSEFYDGRFKEIFGARAALTREGGV